MQKHIKAAITGSVILSASIFFLDIVAAQTPLPVTVSRISPVAGPLLTGSVIDAKGHPITGAKIYYVIPHQPAPLIAEKATTDKHGNFSFRAVSASSQVKSPQIDGWAMAKASGYGFGFKRITLEQPAFQIRLTLPQTYTVAIEDASGKPIIGLPVWAVAIGKPPDLFPINFPAYAGKTDKNGEFKVFGLPQNAEVHFDFARSGWRIIDQMTVGSRTTLTLGQSH